ncbi:MAG TPA: hypothetical protein VK453_20140 [Micromonosporaceae bacterium]|nr:hypothetical protein [Micromonosporaceae bacterium]
MSQPAGPDPARTGPAPSGTSTPSVGAAPAERSPLVLPEWVDPALRVVGAVVAVGLGAVLALIGAFLVPLWGFGIRLPVSLLLALLGNPALAWFAFAVTGRRLAGLLPALAWCVVYLAAATRTTEGDLLLTDNNWVGLATLVAGPLAFAVAIYVLVLRQVGPSARTPAPAVARDSAAPVEKAEKADGPVANGGAKDGAADRAAPGRVTPRRRRPGSAPSRRR